jgi:hypothetical protein
MMKRAMMLVLSLTVFAASAQASPLLRLQDNQLVIEVNAKATPLSTHEFPVNAVKDAEGNPLPGLRSCEVGVNGGKTIGVAPGLYIFDANGVQTAFAPTEAAEFCSETRLSPGKKVLAMDSGTWCIRDWLFFSYPDMKPLGMVSYYQNDNNPALLWKGDEGVFFSSLEDGPDKRKRVCDYDPCGPISTRYHSFKSGEAKTLLAGTDLCDYTLTGFSPEPGEIEADKRCLPSIEAWKEFPQNAPVEHITAKVAAPGE